MIFGDLIGKTTEVYVDDMLVKSRQVADHVNNLRETFQILRKHQMKLNPLKCSFGVASGNFLGFMVNERGIEANPEKIQALLDMQSPTKTKEVQSLKGQVVALSRFISKSSDKSIPFFKILKKASSFEWTEECETSFQQLKDYMGRAALMSKPKEREELIIYLGVFEYAVSTALIREEDQVQYLKPDSSDRFLKWVIELVQFNIQYKPRTAIKGQILADFVEEFTGPTEEPAPLTSPVWELFVDGSSNEHGSGAGVLLVSPEGHKIPYALRFRFGPTNNEAEYEALLAGLHLAREVKAERLKIFSDSQLMVCQVQGEYQARGLKMVAYLQKAQELLRLFNECEVNQVPRSQNSHADALARLASVGETNSLGTIPIDFLAVPSTEKRTETLTVELRPDSWMKPIIDYLQGGQLPNDKLEARCLRARAVRYCICNDMLYKRGFSIPLLRCIDEPDFQAILNEIHAGHCSNHAWGVSLAQKAFR
ncbi:uncharacterized protein LOC127808572 [Diospyros lotus]|uniref:uncharacterized protein LOC127808572 n=1 Tax=Diospyros lotus TaxID=55363 RepID=UPI00224FB75C|nr:uncharacterized protein LOC127808572 [Diospyros lotus]